MSLFYLLAQRTGCTRFVHARSLSCLSSPLPVIRRMVAGVAGTVGGTGIERIKGTDKEGLLDVNRIDRFVRWVQTCVFLSSVQHRPPLYPADH